MVTDVKENVSNNAKGNVQAEENVKAEIKIADLEFKKWIMAYQFKVYKKGIKKKVLPGAIMRLWSTWWTQDFPYSDNGLRLKVGSGGNIMNCPKGGNSSVNEEWTAFFRDVCSDISDKMDLRQMDIEKNILSVKKRTRLAKATLNGAIYTFLNRIQQNQNNIRKNREKRKNRTDGDKGKDMDKVMV